MKPLDIFASSLGHWYNLHLHATLTAENWHYDTPQIIRKPSKQDWHIHLRAYESPWKEIGGEKVLLRLTYKRGMEMKNKPYKEISAF